MRAPLCPAAAEHRAATKFVSFRLCPQREVTSVPRGVAALAMTLFKLGQVDDAREAYDCLRRVLNALEKYCQENEMVTALFEDCSQWLQSSDGQGKPPGKTGEDGD